MRFGIPKETYLNETRVALSPAGVDSLVRAGNDVFVQSGAGAGAHFTDDDYREIGAQIVYSADEAFQRADVVLKVAPLTSEETDYFMEGQIILSFLHLPVGSKTVVEKLLEKNVTAIGSELIEDANGLPVLRPLSEIAGQLEVQVGDQFLKSVTPEGGGVLPGGISGVAPAAVVVLGAGVVGTAAARAAIGKGAHVIVLDRDVDKLRMIDTRMPHKVTTVVANDYTLKRGVKFADVLIGAIQTRGGKMEQVVTEEMVGMMKPGAVIVDVAVDQGGCVATTRPTTIQSPTFVQHKVIHYCVPNLTSLVARTASYGVTNATMPYLLEIADRGLEETLAIDPGFAKGVCTKNGAATNRIVAETFNLEHAPLDAAKS